MKPEFLTTNRRGFLRLSAGALAVAALGDLAGCGSDLPLKVAAQAAWPGYSLLFLAQKQGWLPKEQVTLLNTDNLGASAAMLLSGKADAAAITLDEVLHIGSEGVPLTVIAILDVSAGGDVVMARENIKQLSDLKGKSIGVEKSSLGAIMLAKLLEAAKLKREDIQVVSMDYDHLKSLQQHHLDAIITYEPNPTLLEKKGYTRLFDSRSLPNLIVDLLAVRQDRESQHAAALHKLVDGHFKAFKLWQTNPVDAAYQLASFLDVPSTDVKKSFHGLNLPDISYNHHYLTAPADDLNRSAGEIASILLREGVLKQSPKNDRLFVAEYLPEIS